VVERVSSTTKQKEDPEARQERPSFSAEPRDAALVNARGIWHPEAKPAIPYSGDRGGNGNPPAGPPHETKPIVTENRTLQTPLGHER
jgi:hypothetical protein